MEKPVGMMHFAGTYGVSVYRTGDAPGKIFNVEDTFNQLRETLLNRKRCKRLSSEQYEAIVNQFAHFAVLSEFGVPTFPMIKDDNLDESPDVEMVHLLTELKEKIERIKTKRKNV